MKPPNAGGVEQQSKQLNTFILDVASGRNRRKLVRELEKEGIKWHPQVERRWLAGLLGDEKAVAPLSKFLKTTGIGEREGARERELE